jgi:hypothetical protein
MQTTIHEIAPDIFRLSTHVEEIAPPAGFSFNQFLIRGDEPFLFHTGMRQLFPLVSDAVSRLSRSRTSVGSRSRTSRRTNAAP